MTDISETIKMTTGRIFRDLRNEFGSRPETLPGPEVPPEDRSRPRGTGLRD